MSLKKRKVIRPVLKVVGGLLLILLISLALLLLRLSSGPIQLNQLVPKVEQAASNLPGDLKLKLEGLGLVWDKGDWEVNLKFTEVDLIDTSGSSVFSSPEVDVSLSIPGLVRGVVALSSIKLLDIDVRIVRNEDGTFQFQNKKTSRPGKNPPSNAADKARDIEEMVQQLFKTVGSEADSSSPLHYLGEVEIEGKLEFEDRQNTRNWQMNIDESLFVTNREGISADLEVKFGNPQALAGLGADIKLLLKRDSVDAGLAFRDLNLAGFAPLSQSLEALSGIDIELSGNISTTVEFPKTIKSLKAALTAGSGRVSHKVLYPNGISINSLDIKLVADPETKSLEVSRLEVSMGAKETPLLLHSTAEIQMHDKHISVSIKPELQGLQVNEMDVYWPQGVAKGARHWLVNNLTAGLVERSNLDLEMLVPRMENAGFQLSKLQGKIKYKELTVSYFGSLPSATRVSGSGTYDQNGFDLDITGGVVNGVRIEKGKVAISGLADKKAAISVNTHLNGELSAVFKILEAAPIELNKSAGFGSAQMTGQVRSDFSIALPMRSGLSAHEIRMSAKGHVSKGGIDKIFHGFDVKAAEVDIVLDQVGLQLSGSQEIAGIPVTLDWKTGLKGERKGQYSFKVNAAAISANNIATLGYQVSDYMQGNMAVSVEGMREPAGGLQAMIKADLSSAEIKVPQIHLDKPPGEIANLDFQLNVKNKVTRISEIDIAIGELKSSGNAELEIIDSHLSLVLEQIDLSIGTLKDFKLERRGSKNFQFSVQGGELSLEHYLEGSPQTPPTSNNLQITSNSQVAQTSIADGYSIEIAPSMLDRLYINKDTYFEDIHLTAVRDKKNWQNVSVSGHNPSAGEDVSNSDKTTQAGKLKPGQFSGTYGPVDNGQYPVKIEIENLGALVSAIKGRNIMEGGYLKLGGKSSGPLLQAPIETKFEIDHFTVKEAPTFSKVLNMASLTQIISNFKQTGLAFNSWVGDLKLEGSRVSSEEMRASGGSMGLIVGGWLDLNGQSLDANGTVVPLAKINHILGKIPLLGKVVTGPDGKGLIAVNYTVQGSFEKPKIEIQRHPLSSGILKKILGQDETPVANKP